MSVERVMAPSSAGEPERHRTTVASGRERLRRGLTGGVILAAGAAASIELSTTIHRSASVSGNHLVSRPSMSALSTRSGRTSASVSAWLWPPSSRMPFAMPVQALSIFALMSTSLPPASSVTTSRPATLPSDDMNMYGHASAYTHDTPRASRTNITAGTSASSLRSFAAMSRYSVTPDARRRGSTLSSSIALSTASIHVAFSPWLELRSSNTTRSGFFSWKSLRILS